MVAIVGFAIISYVLFEIPPAAYIIGFIDGTRLIAVLEVFTIIITLDNESQINEREIKVTLGLGLTRCHHFRNAVVEGI